MNPGAKEDFDYFDNFNSPRFINYLEIKYPKKHVGMTYTKDIVPAADEYIWSFNVESNLQVQETSLKWDHDYTSGGKQLYLLDVQTHQITNMLTETSYQFDRSVSKEFRVVYGDSEFVKDALVPVHPVLYDPYPNPFTDRLVVEYALPVGSASHTASLSIYDSNGNRLTAIELPAVEGSNTWTWESPPQASGLYLVRLVVGKETIVKKVLKR